MATLKGLLMGSGLALVGTIAYLSWVMYSVTAKWRAQGNSQGSIGFDVMGLVKGYLLFNVWWWLMVLTVISCSTIYFSHRATA
jgi:hypothetical protein